MAVPDLAPADRPQASQVAQTSVLCGNCAVPLTGPFCNQCGQRHRTERLTLRQLAAELPTRHLNLNAGLLHTFVELWRRPGQVARDYVAGQRVRYMSPLGYFLLAATLQLIMLALSSDVLREMMQGQLAQDPATLETLGQYLGDDPAGVFAEIYINLIRQAYTYMALLFMCVPYALLMRFFFRGHSPDYNLAETLVFAIYTVGHIILLFGLVGVITIRIDPMGHSILAVSTFLVYGAFAARGFYGGGIQTAGLSLLAMFASYLAFLGAIIAMFVLMFVLHVAGVTA